MKSVKLSILVVVLVLASFLTVSAQPPEPNLPPSRAGDTPTADTWRDQVAGPFVQAAAVPASAAVDLGQPGLSFRYARTYGETRVPYLADNDHLFRPWGVTVDSSGNVYVTEGSGHRMMKFTPNGAFLTSIGQGGDWLANNTNRINVPRGVAVDAGGNIWIAEGGSHRVSKWDATGKYVSQLGETWNQGSDNNRFRWPSGIAFDAAGRLYIVDDDNQRIQIFDSGGNYSATLGIGTCGSANNQFCDPQGVAVDSAGRLYVADQGNERIQIFDASLNYLATLGVTGVCGQANNQLCDPSGVTIGPDGKVYVSDSRNNRVQIFTPYPALSHFATLGVTGQWGSDNAHFGWTIGIAVDAGGNIYVVEEDNSRVQKFDSNRNYVRTFGVTGVPYLTDNLHFAKPTDAAVDAAGNLIVLEQDGQRFVKLDPNGTPLFAVGSPGNPSWSQSGFCWPAAIATDGVGRIYVTDTCSNRIQVYDPGGAYLATVGTGYGTGNDQFNLPRAWRSALTGTSMSPTPTTTAFRCSTAATTTSPPSDKPGWQGRTTHTSIVRCGRRWIRQATFTSPMRTTSGCRSARRPASAPPLRASLVNRAMTSIISASQMEWQWTNRVASTSLTSTTAASRFTTRTAPI